MSDVKSLKNGADKPIVSQGKAIVSGLKQLFNNNHVTSGVHISSGKKI